MKTTGSAILIFWALLMPFVAEAQTDTTCRLDEVLIISQKTPSSLSGTAPTQVVTSEKMEREGMRNLGDVARQLGGVTLKDYGGIGGVKTISARGLSSQFSTLVIDGVAVGDAQNGQVDLGRYAIGNSSYISFSNGQSDEGILSARSLASGSQLNMVTSSPIFYGKESCHLKVGLEGGSFATVSGSVNWEQKISKRLSLNFFGHYIQSEGDYPFKLYYTNSHNDSSSVERRSNSQTRMLTGDGTLFWHIATNQMLTAKIHFIRGYHELPGPVILYSAKGSERSEEQLFFAQARYQGKWGRWEVQALGKLQTGMDLYEDTASSITLSGLIKNEYRQQEAYLSAGTRYSLTKGLWLFLACDEIANQLNSNLESHNDVFRLSNITAAGADWQHKSTTIKLSAVAQSINEPESMRQYRKVSPYVSASVKLLDRHDSLSSQTLRIRYFFKETYRIPNFNELYYFTIGRELNPEQALQNNIGITFSTDGKPCGSDRAELNITADIFYNRVRDKIIAMPTQNMFLWSMKNLGRADITGADLSIQAVLWKNRYEIEGAFSYSFQKALDKTDPDEKSFGHQIPYIPKHSIGAALYFKTPWGNIGYRLTYVGKRYFKQQNTPSTLLPSYADQCLSIDRTFRLKSVNLKLRGEINNLFDVQYEVVKSYPMMGRNYRLSIVFEL